MSTTILRPHHILDILVTYGKGEKFTPQSSGNAVHTVAALILKDLKASVLLHIGADDICRPCSKLIDGTKCTNVLKQLNPPVSMQEYNDELDKRLLDYLCISPDTEMNVGQFYKIVAEKILGIEKVCTHPGEDETKKSEGLRAGLAKLGYIETLTNSFAHLDR